MSFDLRVFELGWDFILSGERYRALDMTKVPIESQHEMCGLFRQATSGNINLNYSGCTGAVLRNCESWKSCEGMSKPEAIKTYCAKADKLVSQYS